MLLSEIPNWQALTERKSKDTIAELNHLKEEKAAMIQVVLGTVQNRVKMSCSPCLQ